MPILVVKGAEIVFGNTLANGLLGIDCEVSGALFATDILPEWANARTSGSTKIVKTINGERVSGLALVKFDKALDCYVVSFMAEPKAQVVGNDAELGLSDATLMAWQAADDRLTISLNDSLCEFLGLAEPMLELSVTSLRAWVSDFDFKKLGVLNRLILQNKRDSFVEIGIKNSIGHQRFLRVFVSSCENLSGFFRDITIEYRQRLMLLRNLKNYRHLISRMNAGVFIARLHFNSADNPVDYEFVTVNPAFEEYVSKEKEDLIGRTCLQVFGKVDKNWLDIFNEVVNTQVPYRFTDYDITIGKFLEVSVFSPESGLFACTFNDISDKVDAINEARKVGSYAQKLIDIIPDLFYVFDANGVYLECNTPENEQLFASKKDVLGRSVFDVMPAYLASVTAAKIENAIFMNLIQEYQFSINNGAVEKYYDARFIPLEDKKVACIVRNITQRKEYELNLEIHRREILNQKEFLENIVNGVSVPLWVAEIKHDGVVEFVLLNKAFENLFQQKFTEGLQLNVLKRSYIGSGYQNLFERITNSVRNMSPKVFEEVIKVARKQKYLLTSLVPIMDLENNRMLIIGSSYDITNQKQIEIDLIGAKELAQESDRLKSIFLANMSHEIRTPLNAIVGFTDLIIEEEMTVEERANMVRLIAKNSDQLLKLINDIIDISKIEAGELRIRSSLFDINEMLDNLQPEFDQMLVLYRKEKDLKLICEKPHNGEEVVHSDESRVNQILANLVGNAIKFSHKGNITYGYCIKADEYEFYVHDKGIGIPQDKIPIIFDLFKQLDEGNTRKYGGSGLGLAICKRLIQKLGGRIWVDSQPGEGASFYFTIKRS